MAGANAVATSTPVPVVVDTTSTRTRPHLVCSGPHSSCSTEYARACTVTAIPATATVVRRSAANTGTSGSAIDRSRVDQKIAYGRTTVGESSQASAAPSRPLAVSGPLPPACRGVEVGLGVADSRQRAVDGEVAAAAGDEQVLGRELGDDLAAVLRDDDLLLDAGRPPAIGRRPVGLQREDHALLDELGVLEGGEPGADRLLPVGQHRAVSRLPRGGSLLVGEAELLGLGPQLDDVGSGGAGPHRRDRPVHVLPGDLVRIDLRRRSEERRVGNERAKGR